MGQRYVHSRKRGAEEQLDGLQGTYVFGDWTFAFDGKGKVSVKGGDPIDYTFDGTNISFSYDWEDWTGTINADGSVTLSSEYDDSFGSHICSKQ